MPPYRIAGRAWGCFNRQGAVSPKRLSKLPEDTVNRAGPATLILCFQSENPNLSPTPTLKQKPTPVLYVPLRFGQIRLPLARKFSISSFLCCNRSPPGSTLRLFKLNFQYSTEHTGSGVSGVALSLWGQGAHILFFWAARRCCDELFSATMGNDPVHIDRTKSSWLKGIRACIYVQQGLVSPFYWFC
jgi:hypothetical protein